MTIEYEVTWERVSPHTTITYKTTKEELTWLDRVRGKTSQETVTSFTMSYKDPDDSQWDTEVTIDMGWLPSQTVEQLDTSIYHHRLLSSIPSHLAKNIIKTMDEPGRYKELDSGNKVVGNTSVKTLHILDRKTGLTWKAKNSWYGDRDIYTLESPIGLSCYDKQIIAKTMFTNRDKQENERLDKEVMSSHQYLQQLYGDN